MASSLAPPAPPTPPEQCSQWLVERVRELILNGEIRPGEWLRQERVAQRFGVSQTPVREALKQLSAEGLLEYVPYRGIRVREFTATDIEDLYDCRSCIEAMAARHAATRLTDAQLRELREVFELMEERLRQGRIAEHRVLNRQFHTFIIEASGRSLLVRTLAQMWGAFPSMLWSNLPRTAQATLPGRDESDREEHIAILAALEARDPDAAERTARRHIQHAKDLLLGAIRSQV